MNTNQRNKPWWLLFHLLGLDAPLAALAWALVYVHVFSIIDIPNEPIFLLCIAVWVFLLITRLIDISIRKDIPAISWKASFFHAHLFPLCLLLLCALLAIFWMSFFYVGRYFLSLILPPFLLWLFSVSLPCMWRHFSNAQILLQSWAFALSCSAPAWFCLIYQSPAGMLSFPPTLALTVLIFLFLLGRRDSGRELNERCAFLHAALPIGIFLLLIYCIAAAWLAGASEKPFYYAIAMGAAFLQILDRLCLLLPMALITTLGWLLIALPAFFSHLFFI